MCADLLDRKDVGIQNIMQIGSFGGEAICKTLFWPKLDHRKTIFFDNSVAYIYISWGKES
jgi:hypothetical protein